MITQQELKELLSYDPLTGIFTWKPRIITNNSQFNIQRAGKPAGCIDNFGYVIIKRRVDGKIQNFKAHRLVWLYMYGHFPEQFIDHIDGNRTNNKLSNLRECSSAENSQNFIKATSKSETGLLGVVNYKRGKKAFGATIKVNGKQKHLGMFYTSEEAHQKYLETKRELHTFCTI